MASLDNSNRGKASPQGCIKIKVDAGWSGETATGFGMVACSSSGEFLFAASSLEPQRKAPQIAEESAMRWCLMVAQELEFDTIVVESNAAGVINALTSPRCPPDIAPIIKDCIGLTTQFSVISFCHVKRKANGVAHALSSIACDFQVGCGGMIHLFVFVLPKHSQGVTYLGY